MEDLVTKDAPSPSKKYPESVMAVSNLLRSVEEEERNSKGDLMRNDNDRDNRDLLDGLNSSSSESSTPTGSPSSSISHSRHICGSLFVKCSQHGRSPLLQTFTDTSSYLSQQTFTNRQLQQKSDAFEELFRRTKTEFGVSQGDITPEWDGSYKIKSQIASAIDRKNYSNPTIRVDDGNIARTEPRVRAVQRLVIRRHNSLPSKQLKPETLYELREIFAGRNSDISETSTLFDDKRKCDYDSTNHDIIWRGRSKSEGKITRNVPSDKESETVGQSRLLSSGNNRNLSTDHLGCLCLDKTSTYYLLHSSSEMEEPCDGVRYKCLSADAGRKYLSCQTDSNKDCKTQRVDRNSWDFRANGECLQSIINQLKKENKQWAHKVDFLETEILLLRRELKKRDKENTSLQREINKLRSVLQQTSIFKQEDILSSLQDSHGMPGQIQQVIAIPNPNKKQGVSGESSDNGRNLDQIEIQRFDKDFRSKQLIKDALMENDYLKNLDLIQVREIVESVYPKEFEKGSYVIKEGETGSHLYVSAEGEFEVIKDHKKLGRMGPGKAFGELAILYNCLRTASIKVASNAKVWVLDRRVFQQIMMKTGLQRLQENINFLRSVPLLQPLKNDVLAKIADVLEVDFYPSGAHIIRQGASGDTFFIISSGRVKVTQQKPGRQEEEEIRTLGKGDYFGEQALLKEDWRTANVIALSPGVECLTLDRESFIQLIGDLSELHEKNYQDQDKRGFSRPSSTISLADKEEYGYIRLEDLEVISTLGVGGFGRVELVQYANNMNMTFALKCLKKQHIVDTQQQEHVYSERNIMMACNSPFICRLYRTFRDSKYVYMLLEACLGGEVWTILRERGYFDDYTTRFITGCVVEAFEYLHARGIIYRDLKPENLLLDNLGYVKIVDFGFSKRIGYSSKTWTFCGTPEYVAPEIILNKGHDRAVDYWSLGILMHELLTGTPPFTAPDPMRTYNIILKGIDMIDFPKHVTRAAQSLIKRLCRDSPSERLGYQRGGIEDIKKHKWFQGFDWTGLKKRALGAPITPLVRGPLDASNFDYYSKESDLPPDEFSNWDAEF